MTLLGCSNNGTVFEPPVCTDYLDCLSQNDFNLLDDEVAVYGPEGTCLKDGTSASCEQACETRLEQYSSFPGCGGEENMDSRPGALGGLCLAPVGTCEFGVCNREENYCYKSAEPCRGFSCGGAERGACVPSEDRPSCVCSEGFENESFSLYCCPTDGSDPACG